MSRNTMSGRERLIEATASRPVVASPTISTSTAASRSRRTLARAGASSSTISARKRRLLNGGVCRGRTGRQPKRHDETVAAVVRRERRVVSIEKPQARARRSQTDADAPAALADARRRVLHADAQLSVINGRDNEDLDVRKF